MREHRVMGSIAQAGVRPCGACGELVIKCPHYRPEWVEERRQRMAERRRQAAEAAERWSTRSVEQRMYIAAMQRGSTRTYEEGVGDSG